MAPGAPCEAPRRVAQAGDPTKAPVIECRDLVVRYGARTAVAGVSFDVSPGEVVTLLGPNGAGKTSTVEVLEGYRRPWGGEVRVLGLDPATEHRAVVPRIGVMLQRGGVYPMLSARQVLDLFASYYADPRPTPDLLELVGLSVVSRTPWRRLSGGEQQRLSLALALVGRPEVAFLDEPTSGVDPEGRTTVRQVVGALRSEGVGVLLTTHELAEAERLADRVLILRTGRLVAAGTPSQLAAAAGRPEVRFAARAGLDTGDLGQVLDAPATETEPGRYLVAAPASPELVTALAAWLGGRGATLEELRTGRSLEEVYLGLVGADRAREAPDGAGGEDRTVGRRTRRHRP